MNDRLDYIVPRMFHLIDEYHLLDQRFNRLSKNYMHPDFEKYKEVLLHKYFKLTSNPLKFKD